MMDALREERVVMVPGRICHPRAADPSFKSVGLISWYQTLGLHLCSCCVDLSLMTAA